MPRATCYSTVAAHLPAELDAQRRQPTYSLQLIIGNCRPATPNSLNQLNRPSSLVLVVGWTRPAHRPGPAVACLLLGVNFMLSHLRTRTFLFLPSIFHRNLKRLVLRYLPYLPLRTLPSRCDNGRHLHHVRAAPCPCARLSHTHTTFGITLNHCCVLRWQPLNDPCCLTGQCGRTS